MTNNNSIYHILDLEHSKNVWDKVAEMVLKKNDLLAELMELFFNGSPKMNQRSSQCISKIHDQDQDILKPYFSLMIDGLYEDRIDAFKRNVLRIFQDAKVPEDKSGKLFDIALKYLLSREEAIAIQAFSMTVLRRICETYPELSSEVIDAIEIRLEEKSSSGLDNRGKHELKKLNKILLKFNSAVL